MCNNRKIDFVYGKKSVQGYLANIKHYFFKALEIIKKCFDFYNKHYVCVCGGGSINLNSFQVITKWCHYDWNTQWWFNTNITWWRHQMETFSALLAICAGNSPVTGEFPAQRPVTWIFDVFFDLRLNKRLSKQWWGWWFKAPSRPLWRHCNGLQGVV